MYWRHAVTSRDNFYFRRRKSGRVAAIHEHETIVDENTIWIESRRVLPKSLRIGIDRHG